MATGEIKSFERPDETRPFKGKGGAAVLSMSGRPVIRGVFEPGWRWSTNVKPIAGTDSCQADHLGYCLSGRMRIHMDDGATLDLGPGEVFAIPPGHDAETLGNEACVLVDFGEVGKYAKPS